MAKLTGYQISAIAVLVIMGALSLNGSIDTTTTFILIGMAVLLSFLDQNKTEDITFEEAKMVAQKILYREQTYHNIIDGDIKFSGEGEPTWDENKRVFVYDVVFDVTSSETTKYYMMRISLDGSWLGMTEVKRKKPIHEIHRDVKQIKMAPRIVKEKKEDK